MPRACARFGPSRDTFANRRSVRAHLRLPGDCKSAVTMKIGLLPYRELFLGRDNNHARVLGKFHAYIEWTNQPILHDADDG